MKIKIKELEMINLKKVLIGLFTLSVIALGNEATMRVTANVMESLTVRVDEDVNFGNVARGSSGNLGAGKFSVKGELGSSVNITLKGLESGEIEMYHSDKNSSVTARLIDAPKTVELNRDDFVLAKPIKMSLDIPQNTRVGIYTGEFIISARYN